MRLIQGNVTRAGSQKADESNAQLPINNVAKYLKERGIVTT